MSLIVKAKLKEVAKGCNVAGDLAEGLSTCAEVLVKDAEKRAEDNGRKTVMAKDLAFFFTAKKAKENIVVKSKVKDAIKSCNVAGDFADALNNVLVDMLLSACKRADGNSRKTVMAKDL
jgi:histone H3/H4